MNGVNPPKAGSAISDKNRRQRSGGMSRVLTGLFASSFWRKRAKHFIPILLLIVYSATGGSIFWALEGRGREAAAAQEHFKRERNAEVERNRAVDLLIRLIESWHNDHISQRLATFDFSKVDNLVNVTFAENAMDPNSANFTAILDLGSFQNFLSVAMNDSFLLNESSLDFVDSVLYNFSRSFPPPLAEAETKDWSYWTSVFYAGTIYTTVGYGYITVRSDLGRAATMAYALLGIPLVLYTLNQLGRLFVSAIWKCYCGAWDFINWCMPVRFRMRRSKKVVAEFPFAIAVMLTVAWLMMCSGLFCVLEDWTYFTSFYFFFQSLTTIGFGDVKPSHPEYLVGCFFLILIGLALVSMCWSLLQLKFDHLINVATQKITQQFVHTELEGSCMTMDPPAIETEIENLAAGENAWLAAFLDENRKRVLLNEWSHRAKMNNKHVQTEISYTDRAVQNVISSDEKFSQTPQFMSPEHQYRAAEVPYREIRLGASEGQVVNDECRAMLRGLRSILGECRDTLSSKDSTTVVTSSTSEAS